MRKLFIFCLFVLSLFTLSASSNPDYLRPAVAMEEKKNSADTATRYVRPATLMEKKDDEGAASPLYVRPASPMRREETETETTQYIRPASLLTEESPAPEAEESDSGYLRPASMEKKEASEDSYYQLPPERQTSTQDSVYEEASFIEEEYEDTTPALDDYRPYSFSVSGYTFSGYTDYGYLSIYLESYILDNLNSFILFEKKYGDGDSLQALLSINDYELALSFDPALNGKYLLPLLEIEIEKYMNPPEESVIITEEKAETENKEEALAASLEEVSEAIAAEEAEVTAVKEDQKAASESAAAAVKDDDAADAEDVFLFCRQFSYRGIKAGMEVYSAHTSLTLPEGTTDEDIAAAEEILRSIYPVETAGVKYSVRGDTVTLCYPEQTESFLLAAYDALEGIARESLDIISSNSVRDRVATESPAPEEERASAVSAPVPESSETTTASSQTTTAASQTASSSPSPVVPERMATTGTAEADWTLSFSARGGILAIFQNNNKKGIGLSAGLTADYTYSDFSLFGSVDMIIGSPFFITADIGIRASKAVLPSSPFRVGVSAGLSFVPVIDKKVSLYAGIFTSLRIYNVDVFCELRRGLGGYTYFSIFGSYKFK